MGYRGAGRGCDHRVDRGVHDRDSHGLARNALTICVNDGSSECPIDSSLDGNDLPRDSRTEPDYRDQSDSDVGADRDACRERHTRSR